jgi:hypothetical protein
VSTITDATLSRRSFARALLASIAVVALTPVEAAAALTHRFRHPEPRQGVDGTDVLAASDVRAEYAELFDGIRAIPHIADGIGCHCGCGAMPEMRSLLSCYEGIGMAQFCVICSGEGTLAIELEAAGQGLDEIRAAIDRRFG